MRWLDASAYPAWAELLVACAPYASLTGGRYLKDDFDDAQPSSRTGDDFDAAVATAAGAVEAYAARVEPGAAALEQDYERAYAETVDVAAAATMVAALQALDRFEAGEREGPGEQLTPEFVGRATDAQLAASLRRARDADERPKRKARELFTNTPWDAEGARSWAKAHPDEASILTIGTAALALGVGLLSLVSATRRAAPRRAALDGRGSARVAKLCEELGVEPPSGGGLAPTVRLCAAAAEVPYETIGKTVEALELEVFGVAAVAPAAATRPADKKKRKRAAAMTETMASGSMAKMAKKYFAPTIEWDWSGPQTGSGSPDDLVKEFAATWGSMVSVFHPSDPFVVLDSVAKKVAVAFSLVINVDGAGKAPACLITNNPILFTFTFDDKGKVTKWDGLWDPNDPSLVGCVTPRPRL
ncbi:amino acid transmembrane transporter [Aureococcus anophagefferens]|nr:amino acid transmembrane transporter [Aureococcus anophagefferens]